MIDILFVLIVVLFFVASYGLLALCQRLMPE
jgi:hypothetical protein